MKKLFAQIALSSVLLLPMAAMAGADGDIVPAEEFNINMRQISLREGEFLWQQGVMFFDVNTIEIWADGYIPGATYFNIRDWKKLLPEDKNTPMVFYCVNRLCEQSVQAAHQVLELGYKEVYQMPDGIYGWRMSGRKTERP